MAETWVTMPEYNDAVVLQSPNVEAVVLWVEKHRPDIAREVRRIVVGNTNGDSKDQALLALLLIGFAAGRTYQQAHPTLAPDCEYHR